MVGLGACVTEDDFSPLLAHFTVVLVGGRLIMNGEKKSLVTWVDTTVLEYLKIVYCIMNKPQRPAGLALKAILGKVYK